MATGISAMKIERCSGKTCMTPRCLSPLFTRLSSIDDHIGLTFARKIVIPVEIDSMMRPSYQEAIKKLSTNPSNSPLNSPSALAMASKGCSSCLRALQRPLQTVRYHLPPSTTPKPTNHPPSSPELPPSQPVAASPARRPRQPAPAAKSPQAHPP